MKPIIAPINLRDRGDVVANLQAALLVLLERNIYRALDEPNFPTAEDLKILKGSLQVENGQPLFGGATRKLVQIFQIQEGLGDNLGGVVEEKTAARLNALLAALGAFDPTENDFVVKGVIREATGIPYGGVTVRAFDKDLRTEEFIGEAITDGQGSYELKYVSQHFSEAEKGGADLLVRVLGENKKLLATSDIFYNAPAEQIVNLVVYADHGGQPSEWEIINAQLLPLLKNQKKSSHEKYIGLPPEELEGDDMEFLHNDTGTEIHRIHFWSLAHKLATKVGDIPAEAFYGWLRV